MREFQLVRAIDIYGIKDIKQRKRLAELVGRNFKKVKKEGSGSIIFLEKYEAKKLEMIVKNLEFVDDIMPLNEAAEKIGIGLGRLRTEVYTHGIEYLLIDPIKEKLEVGWKFGGAKEYPEPLIPHVRFLPGKSLYLTESVVKNLTEAVKRLRELGQDQKDGYVAYRLAEAVLMEKAYSTKKFSSEYNLPFEFVLKAMHRFYAAGLWKGHLWKGLINPFYINKTQSGSLAFRLKKIHFSYSVNDLANMFNLKKRQIHQILKHVRKKPEYKGIFEDAVYGLRTPKELVGESSEDFPLRRILNTQQMIRDRKVLNITSLARRYGSSECMARNKLLWLHDNGYEKQICFSYMDVPYILVGSVSNDNFVESIFDENTRIRYYYTDLEIARRFHLSLHRIRSILQHFRQENDMNGRIRDGYPVRVFVEKELIDKRTELHKYLSIQSKVMAKRSRLITVKMLAPYSELGCRALRGHLKSLSTQYPSSIILFGNVYYVDLRKLRSDPTLRRELLIHEQTELPMQIYHQPSDGGRKGLPKSFAALATALLKTVETLVSGTEKNVPNYIAPYLEFVLYNKSNKTVNPTIGKELMEVAALSNLEGSLRAMYNLITERRSYIPEDRIRLCILKMRLTKYLSGNM